MPCGAEAGQSFVSVLSLSNAGSQLETRAIALLKKLQSTAHQSPLSFAGRSKARRSSAGRSRGEALYSLNDGPPSRRRVVRPGTGYSGLVCMMTLVWSGPCLQILHALVSHSVLRPSYGC